MNEDSIIQHLSEKEKPTPPKPATLQENGQPAPPPKKPDPLGGKSLLERLPKIAYFSEYTRMPGKVSINDLKARQSQNKLEDGHRVFLALLGLINRKVEDLEQLKQFERLQTELESASNRLTREIFQFWTQNRHLKVQFHLDQGLPGDLPPFNNGNVLRTRIANTRYGVTTSFDQRSEGFVWFFSFLIWFNQLKRNYGENLVILLDEPGLKLHAKAQQDLLRYIEARLAPRYQVVYTTHSPFMIDPANLLRARTVEDIYLEPGDGEFSEPDVGTKVGDDVLSTDRDTIFPLQACLGYEITQTLFVGEHTLLVEGPSDFLYLQWFQKRLAKEKRTSLDRRWTITPCGGIDKIGAFRSLFNGNKLHVAVFTDLARGDKRKIRNLRESKLLRDGHVFTANSYSGKDEADVEDLFGEKAYVDLVNKCLSLQQEHAMSPLSEGDDGFDQRLVKRVEKHCMTLPPEIEEFNHYKPSEFLFQKGVDHNLDGLGVALDRFENLFKYLNALLD